MPMHGALTARAPRYHVQLLTYYDTVGEQNRIICLTDEKFTYFKFAMYERVNNLKLVHTARLPAS